MATPKNHGNYKNGLRAGYTQYRYGGEKPVTLAGPRSPRFKPILKGQAREVIVDQAKEVMRGWRASPFEKEGAVRAGLRIGFVLQGHDWNRSDTQALEIVGSVLSLFGAQRPDHDEAQRGHALAADFCSWCFCPIDEEDRSRGRRFCSAHCARMAIDHMARKSTHHYGAALRSAIRILDQEKAAPQTCEHCDRSFKADRKQRFCSIRCAGLHAAGDRAIEERPCGLCGTVFKPNNHGGRYCSQSCAQRAIRQDKMEKLSGTRIECAECGNGFTPKDDRTKYCSPICGKRAAGRAFRERNRPAPQPLRNCTWCGEEYRPKIKITGRNAGYCSRKCAFESSRVARGARLRDLSRRTFDHYIAVPIDEAYRRRLTPQKLDWMLMEMGQAVTGEATLPKRGITDHLFDAA